MDVSWSVTITDNAGLVRGVILPHDLALHRRLNSYSTCTFTVPALDQFAGELLVGERAVQVFRNGLLKFYGSIAAPMTENSSTITVTAHDPFFFLHKRRLQAPVTFTGVDAGEIAWSLINTQNGRHTTRLQEGSITPSVSRDRTYIEGEIVFDLIKNLAAVDDGFFFTIDPVLGVPGVFGEFTAKWPLAGNIALGAKFEYGAGTVSNLTDYTRELNLPLNRVRATGVTVGEQVLDAYVEDAGSIAAYGLYEDERSHPTVSLLPTLQQHALSTLSPLPPATYTMNVVDQGGPGVFIPALWTDFDVGDTVSIYIRHGRLDVSEQAVVSSARIVVSNEGTSEKLESVLMMGESFT